MHSKLRNVLLLSTITFSGIVVALLIIEIFLRLMGFEYYLFPKSVQFGWPDPLTIKDLYVIDKDLLWIPEDYAEKVTSWRGKQPSIVFMGCSTTEFGKYDEYFQDIVDDETPQHSISFLNVGVGGWSSYQGLQQLKKDIISMKPRIITINYGWNDHWISFGIEDKEIGKFNREHPILFMLNKLRIVQLIDILFLNQATDYETSRKPERVSLEDFRINLVEMIQIARENDIVPVLMTAPSSHTMGNEPVYLADRWLNDLDELIPIHIDYVRTVREISDEYDVLLVDLAREFEEFPIDDVKNLFFQKDGIHPTPEGDKIIADLIYVNLKQHGLLELLQE